MKQLSRASVLLSAVAWILSAACSVIVDSKELDGGCGAGTKACEVQPGEFRCVGTADPAYGCARESCVPCTLAHAVEVCGADGECAIGTCEPGHQNCDLVAKNGCEVELDASYENCGRCGTSCGDALREMPRALSAECQAGHCVVNECQDGYADCDGAATNGCEKSLRAEACGRCLGCPGNTSCNLDTQRCE